MTPRPPIPKVRPAFCGFRPAVFGFLMVLSACGGGAPEPPAEAPEPAAPTPGPPALFVEVAGQVGLDFFQFNGMAGDYHMAEITGAGAALFDVDNDGDLDAWLVQGTHLPGKGPADALVSARHPSPLRDRLYRNDLEPGRPGSLRFRDVTEESGDPALGYGMGVAVGDYDNDGWPDLFLANLGSNQLLKNQGPGADGQVTFRDVTSEAGGGIDDDRWNVAATFFDYDQDGWLDLYVGAYLAYEEVRAAKCFDKTDALDYCGPNNFEPQGDRLFRNRGPGADGIVTFEDVTREAGLTAAHPGPALGVVAADFDLDGDLDLYVTNDARPNHYWVNHGGRFTDEALLAGCSVNASGQPEASMGVDAADFDGDGDLDLFMTHLISETNTLFRNDGSGMFEDGTTGSGLGPASRMHTAFGTGAIDIDNDGWLDLFVANGAVRKIEALADARDPFPFHEPNQLYRNLGGARFEEAHDGLGAAFELSEVGRGVAFGDIDNDGDTDILLANNNGPVRLFLNQVGQNARWLGLRLLSGDPPRDDHGAEAVVLAAGGRLRRRLSIDGSYCSSSDPRILFGLGTEESSGAFAVEVFWSDGSHERWNDVPSGRYTDLHRGTGQRKDG